MKLIKGLTAITIALCHLTLWSNGCSLREIKDMGLHKNLDETLF